MLSEFKNYAKDQVFWGMLFCEKCCTKGALFLILDLCFKILIFTAQVLIPKYIKSHGHFTKYTIFIELQLDDSMKN